MSRILANLSILARGRRPIMPLLSSVPVRQGVESLPDTDAIASLPAEGNGDVPVFDHLQRQLGWLIDSAKARLSLGASSPGFMQYCMNAAVRWYAADDGCDQLEPLRSATSVRRIPVTDAQGRVCGVVVLPSTASPPKSLDPRPSLVAHDPFARGWRVRARRLAGRF